MRYGSRIQPTLDNKPLVGVVNEALQPTVFVTPAT